MPQRVPEYRKLRAALRRPWWVYALTIGGLAVGTLGGMMLAVVYALSDDPHPASDSTTAFLFYGTLTAVGVGLFAGGVVNLVRRPAAA